MTDKVSLPAPTEPLTLDSGVASAFKNTPQVKQSKKVSEPWYRWFSKVNTALNSNSDDIDALGGVLHGTFVPTVTSSGGTFNWTVIQGEYAKAGQNVAFSIRLLLANSGNTLAGQPVTVGNLPFTAANSANNVYVVPVVWTRSTSAFVTLQFFISGGGTTGKFAGLTAGAASVNNPLADNEVFHATNITDLWISGCYQST